MAAYAVIALKDGLYMNIATIFTRSHKILGYGSVDFATSSELKWRDTWEFYGPNNAGAKTYYMKK
jgi:hypothetical protein